MPRVSFVDMGLSVFKSVDVKLDVAQIDYYHRLEERVDCKYLGRFLHLLSYIFSNKVFCLLYLALPHRSSTILHMLQILRYIGHTLHQYRCQVMVLDEVKVEASL